MKTYQIDYDLRAPGRNYDALITAIKSYGTWCHALKSSWVIVTEQSASQVHAFLWQYMDRNDGLLVTRLTGEAAWTGLSSEVSDWLQKQLGAALTL